MSALDKIKQGKRLTAAFLYELLYGIANGDLSTQNNNLPYWREIGLPDYVVNGCVWSGDSYGSTLLASMTAGQILINGQLIDVDAVANRAFTASKDTYVDVDINGALTYTEVSNNAASPALAANSIRLAIVVSGASSIAAATSINQGTLASNLPSVSSSILYVSDSLGNLICPRTPNPIIMGYRTASFSAPGSAGTGADIVGTALAIIVPTGRRVEVCGKATAGQTTTASDWRLTAYLRESSADVDTFAEGFGNGATAHLNNAVINGSVILTPTPGLHTYSIRVQLSTTNLSAGSATIFARLI